MLLLVRELSCIETQILKYLKYSLLLVLDLFYIEKGFFLQNLTNVFNFFKILFSGLNVEFKVSFCLKVDVCERLIFK